MIFNKKRRQNRRIIRDVIVSVGCAVAGVALVGLVYLLPYFVGGEDENEGR